MSEGSHVGDLQRIAVQSLRRTAEGWLTMGYIENGPKRGPIYRGGKNGISRDLIKDSSG